MSLTGNTVWRDHVVAGNASSGLYKPNKAEIRAWARTIEGAVNSSTIVKATLAALQAVTPSAETNGGIVLDDATASNNGFYYRSGGAWVKGRGFPDSFAKIALGGTANAQTGSVDSGVDPSSVEVYYAVVSTDNTGAMTLAIDGETARDVVNAAGNALSAGEWTGVVLFFLNDDGDYQLLIDAGAAAAAAQSATDAANSEANAAASAALSNQRYVPVRVAVTTNIDLSTALEAGTVHDGVTVNAGELAIVIGQTDATENGLYVVPAAGAASRAANFNQYEDYPGALFAVIEGTSLAGKKYHCTSPVSGTLGVTDIVIEEFTTTASNIVDADVDANAAIKSSKLAFSQDEADLVTFPLRSVYHRLREKITPFDVNKDAGNGTASIDTPALQEALEYAMTKSLRALHIPAHTISSYYAVDDPLIVNKPIDIIAEHPLVTLGGVGLAVGEYLIKVDGQAFPNLEQVKIKNMTIRPNIVGVDGRGILADRVAHLVIEDVIIFQPTAGVVVTGDRGFSNTFTRLQVYNASSDAFVFSAYTGGGQNTFYTCSFGGLNGFRQTADSLLDSVAMYNCGWEQCVQDPFLCEGDINGFLLSAPRSEKNQAVGGATFKFIPSSGKHQGGIVAQGGALLETDAEAYPFMLGGGGTIAGFEIAGFKTEGYSTALVRNNGAGGAVVGGQIRSNYLQNMTAVVSNGPLTRTAIENNENASGAVTS